MEQKTAKVYSAINNVQKDLCKEGISKSRRNTQGNGYNFRGIDDVYNAVSPLLAQHGLCILPRVLSRACEERSSKSGGALFYVTVEAEFDFVCAEDGSKHTVKTFGEAMDSGDKATNKAMSAAYKYAAFQAFAIPTEGDNDADAQTHAVETKPVSSKPIAAHTFETLPLEQQEFLKNMAIDVFSSFDEDEEKGFEAYQKAKGSLDSDEQVAFWSLFDSKRRAQIKRIGESLKKKEPA